MTICWSSHHPARAVLGLLAGVLLLVSACTREVPPVRQVTQSLGVNADVGTDHRVMVRDLLLISRENGAGWVSASLMATRADALTRVTGTVSKPDTIPSAPLTSNLRQPLTLSPGDLVVLTDRPVILVRSPLLRPGVTVVLRLQFAHAGELEIRVPVYRNQDAYETITPIPRHLDSAAPGDAEAEPPTIAVRPRSVPQDPIPGSAHRPKRAI